MKTRRNTGTKKGFKAKRMKRSYEFVPGVDQPDHVVLLSSTPKIEVYIKRKGEKLQIASQCSECGSHVLSSETGVRFRPCNHLKEVLGVSGTLTRKKYFEMLKDKFGKAGIFPEPDSDVTSEKGFETPTVAAQVSCKPLAIFELPFETYPVNSHEKVLFFKAGDGFFLIPETLLTQQRRTEAVDYLLTVLNSPEFQLMLPDVIESLERVYERYGEPLRIRPYISVGLMTPVSVLVEGIALSKVHEVEQLDNPLEFPELNTLTLKRALSRALNSGRFLSEKAKMLKISESELREVCRRIEEEPLVFVERFSRTISTLKLSSDFYTYNAQNLRSHESVVKKKISVSEVRPVWEGGVELASNRSFLDMCKDFVGLHINPVIAFWPHSRSELEITVPSGTSLIPDRFDLSTYDGVPRGKLLYATGYDASIVAHGGHYGVEVRTGWFLSLRSMFERYREVFEDFNRARAKSNLSCGFHHHVHMKSFLSASARRSKNSFMRIIPKAFYALWWVLERPFITKVVHSNRINNAYCHMIDNAIDSAEKELIKQAFLSGNLNEALSKFSRLSLEGRGRYWTCNTNPYSGQENIRGKKYGTFEIRIFNVPFNIKKNRFDKTSATMASSMVLGTIYAPIVALERAFSSDKEWNRFKDVLNEFVKRLKSSTRRVKNIGVKGIDRYTSDLKAAFDVFFDYTELHELSPRVKRLLFSGTPFNSFSDVFAYRVVDLHFKLSEKDLKSKLAENIQEEIEKPESVEECFDLGGVSYVRR